MFYQTLDQNASSFPSQYGTPSVTTSMQHVGEVNSRSTEYFKLSESMILVSIQTTNVVLVYHLTKLIYHICS